MAKLSDILVGPVEQFQGQVGQNFQSVKHTNLILESGTKGDHFDYHPKQ